MTTDHNKPTSDTNTTTTGIQIPPGLHVEATRVTIRPGLSARTDQWMRMLNERHQECVATLDREKMAFEIIVRLQEPDDRDQLLWITVRGDNGQDISTSDHPIDLAHRAFATEVTQPGAKPATVELLLLPHPIQACMINWTMSVADSPPTLQAKN